MEANKVQCLKCKDIIESKHVHDFVYCKCRSIFVDGGREYLRRGGNLDLLIELSIHTEETKVINAIKSAAWEL